MNRNKSLARPDRNAPSFRLDWEIIIFPVLYSSMEFSLACVFKPSGREQRCVRATDCWRPAGIVEELDRNEEDVSDNNESVPGGLTDRSTGISVYMWQYIQELDLCKYKETISAIFACKYSCSRSLLGEVNLTIRDVCGVSSRLLPYAYIDLCTYGYILLG